MKKIIAVLLLVMFWLVSCGKAETDPVLDNPLEDENTLNIESGVKMDWDEMSYKEFAGTMEELLEKWWEVTCTIKSEQEWMKLEWMIYIDWKKIRTSVTNEMNWTKVKSETLMLSDYTYTWSDNTPGWIKFKNEEEETEEDEDFEEQEEDIEDNGAMKFACKKWVSSKMFDIPSDVEFSEFNEDAMMEQIFWEWAELPEWYEMPDFE